MSKSLDEMNVKELRAFAKEKGIVVPFGTNSKDGIRAVIEDAAICNSDELGLGFDCGKNVTTGQVDAELATAFEGVEAVFGMPAAVWSYVDKTEELKQDDHCDVHIEPTMTGYFVVKMDDKGNELVRIKCPNPNAARREMKRLLG